MSEATELAQKRAALANASKVLIYFSYFLYLAGLLALLALIYLGGSKVILTVAGQDGLAVIIDQRSETYRTVKNYNASGGVVSSVQTRTDYYLSYEFSVAGEVYRRERPVSEVFYLSSRKGTQIHVRYLTGYPELNEIDRNWSFWGIVVPALLALFFLGSGWLFHRVGKKSMKPHAEGQEA